jgi:hypothetical protein
MVLKTYLSVKSPKSHFEMQYKYINLKALALQVFSEQFVGCN